jgi:predicted Zn-dependent protease
MKARILASVALLASCATSAPRSAPASAAPQRTALGELDAAHRADEAGDLAGAKSHLEEAVALSPGLGLAQVDLADALVRLGEEGPELVKALQAGERLEPQNPRLWRLAGAYAEDQSDAAGAIGAYERALSLRPADVRSQFRLAGLYASAGRPQDAIAAYRAVLAIDANQRGARLSLAELLAKQHDLAGAEAELLALTQQDPKNALYRDRLLAVQVQEGKARAQVNKRVMRPLRKSRR